MTYALTAFALACLATALWFAWDWNRMRRERGAWREMSQSRSRINETWWKDVGAPHIDVQPRGPDGRFIKRGK